MSLPWRLSSRADADVDRLLHFLKSPRAAQRASQRILQGLELLSEQPRVGRHLGGAVREIFVRFGIGGYIIRYRLTGDEIVVTRLWHSRETRPRARR